MKTELKAKFIQHLLGKKQEGEGYVSTFMQAIDKNLERLNVKIDELKNMENFLSKVIEIIGTAQYQKPVKKVNKQKIEP